MTLRVGVSQDNLIAANRQTARDMNSQRRFPHAAFFIQQRDNLQSCSLSATHLFIFETSRCEAEWTIPVFC